MSAPLQFALLGALVLAFVILCARPLGIYMADVMEGKPNFALRWGAPLERWIYRACGIDARSETGWSTYTIGLLVFNLAGAMVVYALQRLQQWLPLNPQHFSAVSADSSFNTAMAFVTNTDWQGYSGESTMGYLTQAAGLAVQNFLSAATGMAVAIVLIRGFIRRSAATIGNFWVDVTRSSLLDDKGNPVTESVTTQTQTLPMGPVASQEAIKELGTNGGGFFNANSAHPFENPTALSNFMEIAAILLIPLALTYTFGVMVGDRRQGYALMAAMLILFAALAAVAFVSEQGGNPLTASASVDAGATATQSGGNMEGKETRFGIAASALFASATTGTSTGAVNSAHDSMMPMGGFVPLFLMQLGELTPGGVGTGLYTMLIFAILGVFIAGLMIGRTPEYLGKKIQAREMKLASIFILTTPTVVLIGTAIAVMTEGGRAGVLNPGAHGSAGNNNGSAFAGISANTVFYNVSLGIVMWIGRFWPIVATLAIAGSLASKKRVPVTEGTMPTHGALFTCLLIGTIVLIGVLNYVPALALGPVVEHFMLSGAH